MAKEQHGGSRMRYAIWNNKGGVGKSFLSFMLATELAKNSPDRKVILADMCPQANVSEMVLGGNSKGSAALGELLAAGADRRTVGGYFDARISSPHQTIGRETDYLLLAKDFNPNLPPNLYLIAGDPSLEIQAQVINQIGGQTLPEDAWKNVHSWLRDLIIACEAKLGNKNVTTIIDCNPSFSAYTELAMIAAERLVVPCSCDGSSARAIDNIGALLYGKGPGALHSSVGFSARAKKAGLNPPAIHSVLLNRSTQYNKKASKAFGAMFDAIKSRVTSLRKLSPEYFVSGDESLFHEIPDNHSVAIVCSHLGLPLYDVEPGKYQVHDENPQVNSEPLDRYKEHLQKFRNSL